MDKLPKLVGSHQTIGHEKSDVNPRALAYFALGLCAGLLLIVISMKSLFFYFGASQPLGPSPTPFESQRALPPEPRIQAAPQQDLEAYRKQQQEILDSYGWVDKHNGIVRIPIDRAMDLLIQRGLPVQQVVSRPLDATPAASIAGSPPNGRR